MQLLTNNATPNFKMSLLTQLQKLARAKNTTIDEETADVYIESLIKYEWANKTLEIARERKFNRTFPTLDELIDLCKKTAKFMDMKGLEEKRIKSDLEWPICPKNDCDGKGLILYREGAETGIRAIPCDCHPLLNLPVWSDIKNKPGIVRDEKDLQFSIDIRNEILSKQKL